ncbi:MAG: STAS domain-containing protein [Bacteroidota bacterium]
MKIEQEASGDILILRVSGKLDTYTSGDFEKHLLSSIDEGNKKILVDFSLLDYISSAGLRSLLLAAKKIKTSGGRIVLSQLKEHIKDVFQISGFTAIFPLFNSNEEARSGF